MFFFGSQARTGFGLYAHKQTEVSFVEAPVLRYLSYASACVNSILPSPIFETRASDMTL